MELFNENPQYYLEKFSKDFENDFITLLRLK
jgi:hypothetical protein